MNHESMQVNTPDSGDRGLFGGAIATCMIGALFGILALLGGCRETPAPVVTKPAPVATLRTVPTAAATAATDAGAATTPVAPSVPPVPAAKGLPVVAGHSLYDLDLDLEDQDARALKFSSFRGHPVIISMFYASCPAVCPTLIRDIRRIDDAIPPATRAETRVLLITFDPVNDTPRKLSQLAANHGVETGRWTLARAKDDDATRELATSLGIRYRAVDDGHFNHTSIITLLDRQGAPLGRIDGLNQDNTALLATLAAVPAAPSQGAE